MKYLKTIDQDIENLCKKYGIRNWTINGYKFVDVDGDVRLDNIGLENIPIRFGKVSRWFSCISNRLTSLEGSPQEVGGEFWCYSNKLKSLEGSPQKVGGNFDCSNNELKTLKGGPKMVGGSLLCSNNILTSLEGCPENIGDCFECFLNQLKIIDYLPLKIGYIVNFSYNKIEDIRVEKKSYIFNGRCHLKDNPINEEFEKWNGDLLGFIKNLNRLRKISEILENT